MSELQNVTGAIKTLAEIIKAIFDLIKSKHNEKIEMLNHKIEKLEYDAELTGEKHEREINALKGEIEELKKANEKLEGIDLNSPEVQKKLMKEINLVKNDHEAERRGWINESGDLTKAGIQETASRFTAGTEEKIIETSVNSEINDARNRTDTFVCSGELIAELGDNPDFSQGNLQRIANANDGSLKQQVDYLSAAM